MFSQLGASCLALFVFVFQTPAQQKQGGGEKEIHFAVQ
jgi:hypothetical protein